MRGIFFKRLLGDTRGATAIEYGLICALMVCAMLVALNSVANENNGIWGWVTEDLLDALG